MMDPTVLSGHWCPQMNMPVFVESVRPWALQQMEEGSKSLSHYGLASKVNICTTTLTLTKLWQNNNVKIVIVVGQSPS